MDLQQLNGTVNNQAESITTLNEALEGQGQTIALLQLAIAEQSKALYQAALFAAHGKTITTQIAINTQFYPAESYHQQYLAKNPNGYCGMQGTGISMPHELS